MSTPPTAAERFASIIRCLVQAAITRGAFGLPQATITLIIDRLRTINQQFRRIAARVAAGRFAPRRSVPRRQPAARRPRPPSELPRHCGWLQPLVPEAVQFRAQLENLLRDPDMAELLAAAPASLGRPLRSLCWMLRLTPPPLTARPRPPASPPPRAKPTKTRPPRQRPAPQARAKSPPALPQPRACGPPKTG